MKNIVNITINDLPVVAWEDETILTVARRQGIEIPTLCHDPRLEPYASCYVCVVEIEGRRNLVPPAPRGLPKG